MKIPSAFLVERMKPNPEKFRVPDGRVNPSGIACLYLATDVNTACAEVRPWLGSYISLGQFQTNRDLRIIDCTSDEKKSLPFKSLVAVDVDDPVIVPWEPHEYESVVWGDIGYGMSKPVAREDSSLSYVPTQIIAESLRRNGADGIKYRSLLAEGGANVALFDLKDADFIKGGLMETKVIKFTFVPGS